MGNSENDFDKAYKNRVTGEDIDQVIVLLELYSKKLKIACDNLNHRKIADWKKYTNNTIFFLVSIIPVIAALIVIMNTRDFEYRWLPIAVTSVIIVYTFYICTSLFGKRYFNQRSEKDLAIRLLLIITHINNMKRLRGQISNSLGDAM